jgi:hypothetical protein
MLPRLLPLPVRALTAACRAHHCLSRAPLPPRCRAHNYACDYSIRTAALAIAELAELCRSLASSASNYANDDAAELFRSAFAGNDSDDDLY